VVDDDDTARWLVAHALQLDGFDVTSAPDGAAARAVLEHEQFDVIVLDVRLPEVGGLAVLAGVRACGSRVPVVVITGYLTEGVRGLATMLDATVVLAKPFEVAELRTTVMQICTSSPGMGRASTRGR